MKTAGKLADNLITPEGYFNVVLGAEFKNNKHWFIVNPRHSSEPYKTPMGLFFKNEIENDLEEFDRILCDRFGIQKHFIEEEYLVRRLLNNTNNPKAHEKRINEN
jgi:hypothetical protein